MAEEIEQQNKHTAPSPSQLSRRTLTTGFVVASLVAIEEAQLGLFRNLIFENDSHPATKSDPIPPEVTQEIDAIQREFNVQVDTAVFQNRNLAYLTTIHAGLSKLPSTLIGPKNGQQLFITWGDQNGQDPFPPQRYEMILREGQVSPQNIARETVYGALPYLPLEHDASRTGVDRLGAWGRRLEAALVPAFPENTSFEKMLRQLDATLVQRFEHTAPGNPLYDLVIAFHTSLELDVEYTRERSNPIPINVLATAAFLDGEPQEQFVGTLNQLFPNGVGQILYDFLYQNIL